MDYGGFLGIGSGIIEIFKGPLEDLGDSELLNPTMNMFAMVTDVMILIFWILAIIGFITALGMWGVGKLFGVDEDKANHNKNRIKVAAFSGLILFCIPFLIGIIGLIIGAAGFF